uniref:Uncharacterized protein n=1 Tax=Anguilla anguilla TaxID=7936 RepID=A0A0E9W6V6_ANGAN
MAVECADLCTSTKRVVYNIKNLQIRWHEINSTDKTNRSQKFSISLKLCTPQLH